MTSRRIVSGMILVVAAVGVVSLVLPSVSVPILRRDSTTLTGVLVVFPGLTSSATDNSTYWHKVPMTNTVTAISEVTQTGLTTIPLYAVLGLSDPELIVLSLFIIMLGLSGILLSGRSVINRKRNLNRRLWIDSCVRKGTRRRNLFQWKEISNGTRLC